MVHSLQFLNDLAVVMVIAGVTSALFYKFKQPIVLGYILAGFLIGPHTPPFKLISDQATISTMAELGMIFLMFGMGLHFSFSKLSKIGLVALIAGIIEITVMMTLGYNIGQFFTWSKMDSIFLGAIISISSTTIIVKTLMDLKITNKPFSEVIFGILIIEDIVAIALLVLLSSMAMTGTVTFLTVGTVSFKLVVFLAMVLVFGLLLVPQILHFVYRFRNHEVFLITILAICFGICFLTVKLGYSVALGAFLSGAIMAETREFRLIERLITPIKDMFSAVFFVAIGMLIDPEKLIQYSLPITVLTIAIILGKIISCSGATLLAGFKLRIALPVGMGLAQIGEFSFIIAQLGQGLKVTSDFLYPIAVMASVITTITTPYLVKSSEKTASLIERNCPTFLKRFSTIYRSWITQLKSSDLQKNLIRQLLLKVIINLLLITGIVVLAAWVAEVLDQTNFTVPEYLGGNGGILWLIAMIINLPLIIVSINKIKSISSLIAKQYLNDESDSQAILLITKSISLIGTFIILIWIFIVSVTILPQWQPLLIMIGFLLLVGNKIRSSVTEIYLKAQNSISKLFVQEWKLSSSTTAELLEKLQGAELESITLHKDSDSVGKMIKELDLRSKSGATIVGLERDLKHIVNPPAEEKLLEGDKVILIGNPEQLRMARELF